MYIEIVDSSYGMKLNKVKCEFLDLGTNANIHFRDGTTIPRKSEVKYLGCQLNNKSNVAQELRQRISIRTTVWKKLHIFFPAR